MVTNTSNFEYKTPSLPDPYANVIIPIVTVTVIDSRNRLLLLKREKPGELFQGYWEVVGGRIEFGEMSAEAANRELKEEAGIDAETEFVTVLEHVGKHIRFVDDSYHRIMFVYVTTVGATKITKTEHRHYRWFPLDGLPGNIIPFNKQAIYMSLKHLNIHPPGQLPLFSEYAFKPRLTLLKRQEEDMEEAIESAEGQCNLF